MSCLPGNGAAIKVEDLWYSYGPRNALKDVSLEVPFGAFAAMIGPNGAGKSTFLRLLLGVLKPQRGRITILGRPPGEQGQPIGYVPQGIQLPKGFPISAADLVLMGRYGNLGLFHRPDREDRRRVAQALESVGMGSLGHRLFEDLSGGQQQRVLIARALVGDPCLLILDEPTAGLDPAARARFYSQVCDLQRARGLTLFCASHDVDDVAQHAQTLFVLDTSVRASGPPKEVLVSHAVAEVYHFPPPHVHREADSATAASQASGRPVDDTGDASAGRPRGSQGGGPLR